MLSRRLWSFIVVIAVVALECAFGSSAQAVTITSAPFEIGFGYVPGWTTTETNSANIPLTAGNANGTAINVGSGFTLTPTVIGGGFTGSGHDFNNRTMTSNGASSAWSISFEADFAAAYTGVIPNGAVLTQTTLRLSQISIYAMGYNDGGTFGGTTNTFRILETTSGNTGASNVHIVPMTNNSGVMATNPFAHVVWSTASDFSLAGTSVSREFNVTGFGLPTFAYGLDGFEIFGEIEVSYQFVPEPGTATLLGLGTIGMAWLGRRRRPHAAGR